MQLYFVPYFTATLGVDIIPQPPQGRKHQNKDKPPVRDEHVRDGNDRSGKRRKLGAGLFGGEGFVLQKLTGAGTAFVNFDGEIVEKELAAGELLRVDTGHVAMFEPSVDFDIQMMKGFKNILLGGEGLFLATLRGPGKVWLQTMPMSKLAQKVAQYMPQVGGQGASGGANINLGQLLGGQ